MSQDDFLDRVFEEMSLSPVKQIVVKTPAGARGRCTFLRDRFGFTVVRCWACRAELGRLAEVVRNGGGSCPGCGAEIEAILAEPVDPAPSGDAA